MSEAFQGAGFSFPLGKRTYVMGVLNVTPDSFSDGGLWDKPERAAERAFALAEAGADVIDIGGQSTRPGCVPVSAEEELQRLEPVLRALAGRLPVPISVDTYYPAVAASVLSMGAAIINDVSGTFSEAMAEAVRRRRAGWILMHTGGADADTVGLYPQGVCRHVRCFFEAAAVWAESAGIAREALCFDPGIGFGKTQGQNLTLLRHIDACKLSGCALLTGASRKRVVGEASGEQDARKRLPGTLAAHTAAIAGGSDFIRVHDVAESVQAARVADAIYRGGGE